MFHDGERLAQQLAGYETVHAAIYPAMTAQHRQFFAGLHYFFLATLDENGWPLATLLQGEAGFVRALSDSLLAIDRRALKLAPLLPALRPGMAVGCLGIDFSNRRRNRVNGVVVDADADRVMICVEESFGNCPQYIQRRRLQANSALRIAEAELLQTLDADARYLLTTADTLMVASSAQRNGGVGGVDISHRGGPPGFIRLQGNRLRIPDYRGNRYMNTLGNLLSEPRCALLVMDFQQGSALHIQGRAEIFWQAEQGETVERDWQVTIENVWRLRQLLAPAGLFVDYSPTLPAE